MVPPLSVVSVRDMLQDRLCFQVGSGQNIFATRDPWVPSIQGFKPRLKEGVGMCENVLVKDLVQKDGCSWNLDELRRFFCPESVNAITKQ